MRLDASTLATTALTILLTCAHGASAQKSGGTLRVSHRDSPASMSIHEEGTVGVIMPMMGVFNNLMIYDQHIAKNNAATIVPELATGWIWNEDGTALTVQLRDGVRWHDGQPFTARDVKCTFDLLSNQAQLPHRYGFNSRKSAEFCGLSKTRSDCGAKSARAAAGYS